MGTAKPNVNLAWAQTGTSVDPGNPKYSQGWVTEKPSWQNFNYVLNRGDVFDKHVNEYGICVWDALTTYSLNSITQSATGNIYQSIQNSNTGNDPDSTPLFWKSLSTGISQAATISGVNAYTATISGVTSYNGLRILGFGISANTGACSLNINGIGAVQLVKQNGVPLLPGEIQNAGLVDIAFDGVSWQLMNPLERIPFFLNLAGVNTYTASYTGITSYYQGLIVNCLVSSTNSGASTLNINGLGALPILMPSLGALSPGDLASGAMASLILFNGAFILMNAIPSDNTIVAASYGLNGYAVFRNNLIIQWGTNAFTVGGNTIAFPIAFRSIPLSITAVQQGATAPTAICSTNGNSPVSFVGAITPNTNPASWIAVGF